MIFTQVTLAHLQETSLLRSSLVSVDFSVEILLLKLSYERQKVMQHHFWQPFVYLAFLTSGSIHVFVRNKRSSATGLCAIYPQNS